MSYSWTTDEWMIVIVILVMAAAVSLLLLCFSAWRNKQELGPNFWIAGFGTIVAIIFAIVQIRIGLYGSLIPGSDPDISRDSAQVVELPVPRTVTPLIEPTVEPTPEPTATFASTVEPTPEPTATPPNTGSVHVQKFVCPAGEDGEHTEFFREADVNAYQTKLVGCGPGGAKFTLAPEGGADSNYREFATSTEGHYQVTVEEGIYVLTETDPDLPGKSAARVRVGVDQMTMVIVINYVAAPDPAVTPPASEGEVSYADNFNDPSRSQLVAESFKTSARRFDSGEYVVEKLDPEALGVPVSYLPGTYQDVVVAIDVRLVGETEGRYVVISCRDDSVGSGSSHYRFLVDPGDMAFHLSRWEAGEQTTLAKGGRQDAIAPDEKLNRLQLSCVGAEITAWVNGVEVARVEDTALADGKVLIGTGLYSEKSGTVEARFDNLEITSADAPR